MFSRHRIVNSLFLVWVLVLLLDQMRVFASVKDMSQDLPDSYLGREFSWAMILNLPDEKHYLNYPGSKLLPVTKVRVQLKSYPKESYYVPPSNALYEELWYHGQVPLGMRRFSQNSIAKQSMGAIVICPGDAKADPIQRASAIGDAIVRLLIDAQLHASVVGLVLVPADEFDSVAAALSEYNFVPSRKCTHMQPMNLHLRAYPDGQDDMFYLQN
jgi:hypothetical protein